MSRTARVVTGGINIALHPHSREFYIDFIRSLFELKQPVSVSGETHMIIASVDLREDSKSFLVGTIARYLKFDVDQPWFNENKLDKAEDDDVRSIHIPEGLRPHFVSFYFAFNLEKHVLVYEQRYSTFNVNPNMMLRFMQKLCDHIQIRKKFGPVIVNDISDQGQIEAMLKPFRLQQLRIVVYRPNPDDFGDFEADIEERLKEMNANSVEVVLKTDRDQTIQPDNPTTALAHAATRTGLVETISYNENGVRSLNSTKQHPLLVSHSFITNGGLGQINFLNAVRQFVSRVGRRG